jgi:hypothetical protein
MQASKIGRYRVGIAGRPKDDCGFGQAFGDGPYGLLDIPAEVIVMSPGAHPQVVAAWWTRDNHINQLTLQKPVPGGSVAGIAAYQSVYAQGE